MGQALSLEISGYSSPLSACLRFNMWKMLTVCSLSVDSSGQDYDDFEQQLVSTYSFDFETTLHALNQDIQVKERRHTISQTLHQRRWQRAVASLNWLKIKCGLSTQMQRRLKFSWNSSKSLYHQKFRRLIAENLIDHDFDLTIKLQEEEPVLVTKGISNCAGPVAVNQAFADTIHESLRKHFTGQI